MCGICGIVDHNETVIDAALLSRLNAKLLHRGPDEGGEWTDTSAGLAMRRLAIIDLSGGQQPMFNEDGSIAIVFNGEIYNFHELRELLEKSGHRFKTHSDTETIVHLYEQFGPEGLAKLNGMFALAIWDKSKRQLLLARDRAGKKPLYYCRLGSRIVFSSELTSLLEHPGIDREIDTVALDNYFCLGYVPAPLTIYKSVRQLEPGHYLLLKDGEFKTDRYWRLSHQQAFRGTEQEATDQLLDLLKDAVRIRLYSEVPFGALLSGGVDSGLVVGLMSQLMTRPVQTFTIGFSDKALDESAYAGEVAKLFGTEHHLLKATPHSAIEMVDKLITHFGEPFADASAIPTYMVSEMARQHVTMALSGDGGDEVFGGYPSYQYHAKAASYRNIPGPLRAMMRGTANRLNGSAGHLGKRVRRFLNEAELPVSEAWIHSRSLFHASELADLYTPEFRSRVSEKDRGIQIDQAFSYFRNGGDDADLLNYVDYETYLPGDILVKVDRMSMANSLEMRAPLLDYRIAEFAASLPRAWKWDGNGGKRILKKVAAKLLPASALTRRKRGFVTPINAWLKGELYSFALEVIRSSKAGHIIRLDYCEQLLERHKSGELGVLERKVWSILCFLLWYRKFVENER